jgi:hypothetical protein
VASGRSAERDAQIKAVPTSASGMNVSFAPNETCLGRRVKHVPITDQFKDPTA